MTAVTTGPNVVDRLAARFQQVGALPLVLRLSLLALVTVLHYEPVFMVAAAVVAVVAWPNRRLLESPWLWLVGALAIALVQLRDWAAIDNHAWLASYWSAAVGLSLLARDRGGALRVNGRVLIGVVFALATLWKVSGVEYLDGSFFHYSLLDDRRFEWVATTVGGVPRDVYDANVAAVERLASEPAGTTVELRDSSRLRALAQVFTWYGVVLEAAISVLWLVPWRRRSWVRARNGALLLFACTTYLVVPVGGFGCLLMAMAVAANPSSPRWQVGFVAGFVGLLVYGPIWRFLT